MCDQDHFDDDLKEYWHLLNGVTLWDVGVERQIALSILPDDFLDRVTMLGACLISSGGPKPEDRPMLHELTDSGSSQVISL